METSINHNSVDSSDLESFDTISSNEKLLPQFRSSRKIKDLSEMPLNKNWKNYMWSLILMVAVSVFQIYLIIQCHTSFFYRV